MMKKALGSQLLGKITQNGFAVLGSVPLLPLDLFCRVAFLGYVFGYARRLLSCKWLPGQI
jgi:hypothetical protein